MDKSRSFCDHSPYSAKEPLLSQLEGMRDQAAALAIALSSSATLTPETHRRRSNNVLKQHSLFENKAALASSNSARQSPHHYPSPRNLQTSLGFPRQVALPAMLYIFYADSPKAKCAYLNSAKYDELMLLCRAYMPQNQQHMQVKLTAAINEGLQVVPDNQWELTCDTHVAALLRLLQREDEQTLVGVFVQIKPEAPALLDPEEEVQPYATEPLSKPTLNPSRQSPERYRKPSSGSTTGTTQTATPPQYQADYGGGIGPQPVARTTTPPMTPGATTPTREESNALRPYTPPGTPPIEKTITVPPVSTRSRVSPMNEHTPCIQRRRLREPQHLRSSSVPARGNDYQHSAMPLSRSQAHLPYKHRSQQIKRSPHQSRRAVLTQSLCRSSSVPKQRTNWKDIHSIGSTHQTNHALSASYQRGLVEARKEKSADFSHSIPVRKAHHLVSTQPVASFSLNGPVGYEVSRAASQLSSHKNRSPQDHSPAVSPSRKPKPSKVTNLSATSGLAQEMISEQLTHADATVGGDSRLNKLSTSALGDIKAAGECATYDISQDHEPIQPFTRVISQSGTRRRYSVRANAAHEPTAQALVEPPEYSTADALSILNRSFAAFQSPQNGEQAGDSDDRSDAPVDAQSFTVGNVFNRHVHVASTDKRALNSLDAATIARMVVSSKAAAAESMPSAVSTAVVMAHAPVSGSSSTLSTCRNPNHASFNTPLMQRRSGSEVQQHKSVEESQDIVIHSDQNLFGEMKEQPPLKSTIKLDTNDEMLPHSHTTGYHAATSPLSEQSSALTSSFEMLRQVDLNPYRTKGTRRYTYFDSGGNSGLLQAVGSDLPQRRRASYVLYPSSLPASTAASNRRQTHSYSERSIHGLPKPSPALFSDYSTNQGSLVSVLEETGCTQSQCSDSDAPLASVAIANVSMAYSQATESVQTVVTSGSAYSTRKFPKPQCKIPPPPPQPST